MAVICGATWGVLPATASGEEETEGFAVVELFTSEGCSSCPPADRLLAELDQKAEKQDLPVFVLGMHVDYWNSLGWPDRFSSKEVTARQQRYAKWMERKGVYTPQMIVNGSTHFVGSDAKAAERAINAALEQSSDVTLNAEVDKTSDDTGRLEGMVDGAEQEIEVIVVQLRDTASSKVTSGENSGRTLTHVNIVEKFWARPVDEQGRFTLDLADRGNHEYVVFAQQKADGRIVAAISLNSK
ncbi:DUF1223 domain-containing protein [Stratiformator vulcanicus]|nr:DUF1223 domain-containing protein [Stratiformator vulcanicus]